jgi:hypothetical protein
MITWHENKRRSNLEKHGIDFAECEAIFDDYMITQEDTRDHYGECRLQSLGRLQDKVVFMVWVEREDDIHLISVREATKAEQRFYYANTFY